MGRRRRRSTFGGWEMGTGKERMVQSDFRHHAASLFLLLSHPELCTNPCRPVSRRFPRIRSQLLQSGCAELSIEAFPKRKDAEAAVATSSPANLEMPLQWVGPEWTGLFLKAVWDSWKCSEKARAEGSGGREGTFQSFRAAASKEGGRKGRVWDQPTADRGGPASTLPGEGKRSLFDRWDKKGHPKREREVPPFSLFFSSFSSPTYPTLLSFFSLSISLSVSARRRRPRPPPQTCRRVSRLPEFKLKRRRKGN